MHDFDTPITLRCGITVPGRGALAPLTNKQSELDGRLGEDELRWLCRRAAGGFAWISTCAAYVSEEGKAWRGQLGVASEAHEPGLGRLARGLREAGMPGMVSVVQLHHGGIKAELAPASKLTTVDHPAEGARGATLSDLRRVIDDFVAAAQRAERAGFDGVEIHGANGYLFTQFLAPADNPRSDGYGVDLVGRARLLRETVRAVRAAVGPRFIVGVRLSPVDVWARRGLRLAEGLQVGAWMAEDGVDFIHLSLADAAGPPKFEPDRGSVVGAFRATIADDVPIMAAGGIWTETDAVEARRAGADLLALGRAAIVHPDWPRVAREPSWTPQRPPWSAAQLRDVAVGEGLMTYLRDHFRWLEVSE